MKKDKNISSTNNKVHKLKNHLTSVNLSAELMLKNLYGDLSEQQKKCLKSIHSEGKKMEKIIKELEKG